MRVAVIGAGPAGITAAMRLAQGGAQVSVYEAGDRVGGLARSFDLWGQRVDLGPHRFFSMDARVNRLWLDIMGADYRMVDRLTRIHYRGRFFHYPLRPVNALANMGLLDAIALPGQLSARARCADLPTRSATARSNRGSSVASAGGCSTCSSSPTAKSCGASLPGAGRRFRRPADQEVLAGRGHAKPPSYPASKTPTPRWSIVLLIRWQARASSTSGWPSASALSAARFICAARCGASCTTIIKSAAWNWSTARKNRAIT